MRWLRATYLRPDLTPFVVEYDADAPCIVCREPVMAASMAGTAVCPWCDMGRPRPPEARYQRN
jgi:hypothetical protein